MSILIVSGVLRISSMSWASIWEVTSLFKLEVSMLGGRFELCRDLDPLKKCVGFNISSCVLCLRVKAGRFLGGE